MRSFVFLFLLCTAIDFTGTARASQCQEMTLESTAEKSASIFYGRIKEIIHIEPRHADLIKGPVTGLCGDKNLVFTVSRSWKGPSSSELTIFSKDSCVGPGGYFEQGKNYLVFAQDINGRLETSVCYGTIDLENGYDKTRRLDRIFSQSLF